ncbi:MAG TPA: ADOP family duplicated permease [Acidobacteriota bacterium]|nr:ADOP family duplicated permease [Acidobacteriota bacterium]
MSEKQKRSPAFERLLMLLPRRFRRTWAEELRRSFQDRLGQVREEEGAWGAARLWLRTVVDLTKTGLVERLRPSVPQSVPRLGGSLVMRNLRLDIVCALRSLRRKPALALVAVLTLALGSGLTVAMLSLANAVFLGSLPYPESERLVRIYEVSNKRGASLAPTSYLNYRDWRDNAESFQRTALIWSGPGTTVIFESQGQVSRLQAAFASASYFPLLGVEAALGRTFSDEEDRSPQAPPAVLISHGLWSGRLGADSGIVGKPIELGETPVTVVGVLPRGFRDPTTSSRTDVWLPLTMAPRFTIPDLLEGRHKKYFSALARLDAATSLDSARQEMDVLAGQLAASYPEANRDWSYLVRPLREDVFSQVRIGALVLLAAAGLVLGIVCVNLANLLLVDAASRRSEFAMRLALGAPRRRILTLLMGESLALSAAGGAAGILVAWASLDFLLSFNPFQLPGLVEVQFDAGVVAAALSLLLLLGLAAGLAPAWTGIRLDIRQALSRSGPRGGAGAAGSGRWLVMAEVALAVVVLVGAGLMLRSFQHLRQTGLGLESEGALTLYLDLSLPRYRQLPARLQLSRQLLESGPSLPGASSVDLWAPSVPGHDSDYMSVAAEGKDTDAENSVFLARYNCISPSALSNLGIATLEGRELSPADRSGSLPVVVISESLAQSLWPRQEAAGKRLKWVFNPSPDPWVTVVGVVEDAWTGGRLGANSANRSDIYFPILQFTPRNLGMVVRGRGDGVSDLSGPARAAVSRLDPGIAVYGVSPMDQIVAEEERPAGAMSVLLTAFAGLTTFLALLGIYGVLSRSIQRRTREIGVRWALGARPGGLLTMLMGEGMKLALTATVIGLLSAAFLARWMESVLFGIDSLDPWAFAGVALFMLAVSLLSCYLPARRSIRTDPANALRGS